MSVSWTSTGYSAYCKSEGALTVAGDFDELKINILEVLNLALEDTWTPSELD